MINWVTIPFVRILLPLLLGILLGAWMDKPLTIVWVGLLVFIAPLFYFANQRGNIRERWLFGALLTCALIGFGYWRASSHSELHRDTHFSQRTAGDAVQLVGLIADLPVVKERSVQVELRTEYLSARDSFQSATGNVLLYFTKDSNSLSLNSGDRLIVQASPELSEPPGNPEAFDYRRYLHFQNIHYKAYVSTTGWQRLDERQSWRPEQLFSPFRVYLLQTLREHLTTPETFSVGAALILGYKSEINERIRTSYANTGAMHVLAVSGLHVGLVYVIFGFLLKLVWPTRRSNQLLRAIILALVVWCFALLTGASPSVLRAATMFSLIAMGKSFYVKHYMFNTLALSALIWLVIDPYLLFNVGFQLSYLAVGGIVYFQRKIYKRFVFYNDVLDWAWQLTSVSIAAQILTLPISLYYFHQFPVYFWLSGLVVIPAAMAILVLGLLLFTFGKISIVGVVLGKLLFWLISLVNAAIFFIEALPGSTLQGIWIGGWSVLSIYAFIYLVVHTIHSRQGRWVVACCVGLLLFSVSSGFTQWRSANQRTATIYQLRGASLLDIVVGKNLYSYHSEAADEDAIKFAAQNQRWKQRAKPVSAQIFNDTNRVAATEFLRTKNIWQLGNTRLVRVDETTPIDPANPMPTDLLWICVGVRTDSAILAAYPTSTVILDGSLSRYANHAWRAQLDTATVILHDIAADGAYQFNY